MKKIFLIKTSHGPLQGVTYGIKNVVYIWSTWSNLIVTCVVWVYVYGYKPYYIPIKLHVFDLEE